MGVGRYQAPLAPAAPGLCETVVYGALRRCFVKKRKPTNVGGPVSAPMIIMTAVSALTAALEAFQENYSLKRVRGGRQFLPQLTL